MHIYAEIINDNYMVIFQKKESSSEYSFQETIVNHYIL